MTNYKQNARENMEDALVSYYLSPSQETVDQVMAILDKVRVRALEETANVVENLWDDAVGCGNPQLIRTAIRALTQNKTDE